MVFSSSPERWDDVPVPVDAKKYFPGFVFTNATNSANELTGIATGFTTSMFGTWTTSEIGVKSFRLSYGIVGYRDALMASGPTEPINSVYPSGLALATMAAPMLPPAPG